MTDTADSPREEPRPDRLPQILKLVAEGWMLSNADALVVVTELARLRANYAWLEQEHKEICGRLQNVCQEYHLGLGGERLDIIAVDELRRMKRTYEPRSCR